jgi:PAS domain S-box-containing protein
VTAVEPKPALVAEAQFRLMVECVRDYAIFMLDPGGNVVTWNEGARLIKGYTADEIIGQHLSLFYTPEDRTAGMPQLLLNAALSDGRVEAEGWRVRKDGTHFWADVVITAVRDDGGALIGFGKVTRDLTDRRDAEQRLRQAENRLATTLRSIGDGVLATNEAGVVTMINPVAEELTGWAQAESLGRSIEEVFHIVNEETGERVANPVRRVLQLGTIVGLANHTVLVARDGRERPIADSGAPIVDEEGATRGAVLVFRDATEERRAERALQQSEARLRLMIESIEDYAIVMLDPDGRVATWNSGAERITGYEQDEIVGKHFSRFFTPEDIAAGKPAHEIDVAQRHGRFEDESWRVRKDGSRFWANVVVSAILDDRKGLVGFTKVTRDLTERKEMEEQRIRLARASEALRLRDEFLSVASHELKTPLTALQLHLDGVVQMSGELDDKTAARISKVARASERLGGLIDSLLDVTRITGIGMTLTHEPFDLLDAAKDVIQALDERARNAQCDVHLVGDSVVGMWDRLRVEQVITNLLRNAFRYAGGAPVAVTVRRDGDAAVLEVKDGGPGLSADPESLFDKFGSNRARAQGGLGLGLYFSRQVAVAHGGTLKAASDPNGGARFTLRLPLDPERSAG